MAFDSLPPPVPVAVAVAVDNGGVGGIPMATATATRPSLSRGQGSRGSIYRLPSSRRAGEFAIIPERQIQQLVEQGYTRGHAASLARTIRNFPLRIWVVDNSGSMQHTDGHRFVETKSLWGNSNKRDVKVVGCSRWNELKDCIEYHTRLAAALEAPTSFRMLNDPGVGHNCQQFGKAEESLDETVLQQQIDRAITIMKTTQPAGVTPLIQHIEEIRRDVVDLAPILREDGCRVAIILATDGLPTDECGYGGPIVNQKFVETLRLLEGLPVWLVIRLCTDEEAVVNFYNNLDSQLELSLEVLDDFLEESKEVYQHNPWLNYALPLHRLREMGYHDRVFDLLDERPFTTEELREFCSVLLLEPSVTSAAAEKDLPDPSADWATFYRTVKALLGNQPNQWNPITKKVSPWIDLKSLDKIYGQKRWFSVW